ncbi:MAG: hypothetical protein ACQET8_05780 [Bacillota bacterium]
MRHLKVKRSNMAHRLPRGKRAAWNGNQRFQKQLSLRKQPINKSHPHIVDDFFMLTAV